MFMSSANLKVGLTNNIGENAVVSAVSGSAVLSGVDSVTIGLAMTMGVVFVFGLYLLSFSARNILDGLMRVAKTWWSLMGGATARGKTADGVRKFSAPSERRNTFSVSSARKVESG